MADGYWLAAHNNMAGRTEICQVLHFVFVDSIRKVSIVVVSKPASLLLSEAWNVYTASTVPTSNWRSDMLTEPDI